ncbi:MAG: hypothetical protein K8R69_01440 [Deltaproteobacteria bacterium]|nr:hypothetical protein [Deltaproteobacteria bacterium]
MGEASRHAYLQARSAPEKKGKLEFSHQGIVYAEKCLKEAPKEASCLYFQTLNTGVYIQNHIPNYQRGLHQMVANCDALNQSQPDFEHAGCYRILGNIYSQAPSFSLNPKNITQDLDRSVQNLKEAVKLAPDYALNRLFLARSLEQIGEKDAAKSELQAFDRLDKTGIDQDYPAWKKDRDSLAQKLL